MPETVVVKKPTQLHVSISRSAIAAVAGAVRATGTASVNLGQSLIVRALGTKNLRVTSADHAVLDPSSHPTFELMFDLMPTNLGEGIVEVLFLQGVQKLATLTLKPMIARKAGENVGQTHARKESAQTQYADAGEYPILYINETEHGNSPAYHFFLKIGPALFRSGTSAGLKVDRAAYVAAMYEKIEGYWDETKGDVEEFESKLRMYGAELFDELVPETIKAPLWEARDQLKSILVVADEPFIPWEVVHLKPPREPGKVKSPPLGEEKHFLAQKGLVRWLTSSDGAPTDIRIRDKKAYYVIPKYPKGYELPAAQDEIPFLRDTLKAKDHPAESKALQKLFSTRDGVDHFHFAGHGEAETQSSTLPSPPAKIMMLGTQSGTKYTPSYFESGIVAEFANLRGSKGSRPLVVLNACQVGRASWKLTSIGGFAHAFIERDAGAFVGTLWAVGDEPARTFTEAFYKCLAKGGTISEAARQGRDAAEKAREGTWLAYVVYGHPNAKVTWEALGG